MKILHFPTLIGGNPSGISKAERTLGLESHCVTDIPSPYGYHADETLLPNGGGLGRRLLARTGASRRLMRKGFDLVHFNGGQTAANHYGLGFDLQAWRKSDATLFMTFQGDDCRPISKGPAFTGSTGLRDRLRVGIHDGLMRRHVARASRICDRVFCLNPDLIPFVPDVEFVPYASIDWRDIPVPAEGRQDRLRIVHAPSDTDIKGTAFVMRAREILGEEKYEWRIVRGVDTATVGQELDQADLVLDQFRIGWYGALAVEAMARGVPTLCWLDPVDTARLPAVFTDSIPIVSCTGSELPDAVEALEGDELRRRDLGRSSRGFVQRFHDPRRIAEAFMRVFRNPGTPYWSAMDTTSPVHA